MSSAFPKPGDTFEGKYRIERRVGQGGFAQVFLAVQTGLERKVAIKMFDPNSALESDEISDSAASRNHSANGEPVDLSPESLEIEALDDDASDVEPEPSPEKNAGPPSLPKPGGLPKPSAKSDAKDKDDAKAKSLSNLRNSLKSLNRKSKDAGRDASADDSSDNEEQTSKSSLSLGLPKPGEKKADSESNGEASPAEHDDRVKSDSEIDLSNVSDVSDISSAGDSPTGSNSSQSLQSVVKRFEREARLVSKLRSPYTVTIHDYGQTESGVLFMVMEYVDGMGFDELDLPMEPEKVVNIMRQVLMSLSEAHNIGVLHRDLKPANMMLFDHAGATDQVKLLDFGVAKVLRSAKKRREKQEDLTDGDVLIGTPRYMSPEQILGVDLDASSDIYSFGLVVYELLTGDRAIDLEDEMQILAHHVSPESFTLPEDLDIPRSMRRVVEKMLEKDPANRYESASDVIDDLKRMDPDTSGITLRSGGIAEISQVLKTRAVDISQELKRDAAAMSTIAKEKGWLSALKSKQSRRPLILLGIFLLVGFLSLTLIATSGDDARADSERETGSTVAEPQPVDEPAEEKAEHAAVDKQTPPTDDEPADDMVLAAAGDDADAGSESADDEDATDAEAVVTTVVLTEPEGALVFVGDQEIGPAPVELTSDAYEFPLDLRAVEDEREAELTLEEAGGEATIVLPEPEPEPKPRPKPRPKKKKKKFEFKPLE